MTSLTSTRIEKGSTILITGVTGYIGAWTAYVALEAGYKVRGAVRNIEKAAWLQKFLDAKFPDAYSPVTLSSVLDVAALEKAIEGVSGVIHVAADVNLPAEPEPYISEAVRGTENVLRAARNSSTVKSVVLTISSVAGYQAEGNKEFVIPKDNYNELAVQIAYDENMKFPGKEWVVYAASKVKAEQAAWKFMEKNKPDFVLNTILPDLVQGPSLVPESQGFPSTGGWTRALFDGKTDQLPPIPPNWFIDVRDTARLHVGALIAPSAKSERFWGFAEPVNFNRMLSIFRKLFPERKFVNDLPDAGTNIMTPPTQSATTLLKEAYGQNGFTKLEATLKDAYQPLVDGKLQ